MAQIIVTTATELNSKQQEKISGALKKKVGPKADLLFAVDPTLIGGIRIKVNTIEYDGSLAGRLKQVTQQIQGTK